MHLGLLSLRARQDLHARAIGLKAAPDTSDRRRRRADAGLIEICRAFDRLERRKIGILKANSDEDVGLELEVAKLEMEQERLLLLTCEMPAVTMCEHRARATAFASWDGGSLAYRADLTEATENLVLLAMIRDLTRASDEP